ncbi:LamG-like jellyroll fold domain-containing protein [Emticicia sp. 17c]|uniref:LamG-like jellyroll fold domain-containing protein n=1 Tax=Emticicia sp. 17c TaxID=3127704 RepID=UPI00301CD810
MKNIKPGHLFISLLAFLFMASFTRPLKELKVFAEEKINSTNQTLQALNSTGSTSTSIESVTAFSIDSERLPSTSNSAISISNIDSVSKNTVIDNSRIGQGVGSIKPLPVKSLPIAADKKIPLNELLGLDEKEYYKYDSVAHTFRKIESNEKNMVFDPVRFRLSASKDSIAIGEEFEIKITAEFVDVNHALMFQFEGSNEFTLKMLLPDGFIQTGGTYYDFVQGKVTKENPRQEFAIRGFFEKANELNEFKLLRGAKGAGINASYYVASKIIQNVKTPSGVNTLTDSTVNSSIAATDCDVLTLDVWQPYSITGYETNNISLGFEALQHNSNCAWRSEIRYISFDLYKRRSNNSELFLKNVEYSIPTSIGTMIVPVIFNDKESLKDGEIIVVKNISVDSKYRSKIFCNTVIDSWWHQCDNRSAEMRFCPIVPQFNLEATKASICSGESTIITVKECLSGTITWNTGPFAPNQRTITTFNPGTYTATCNRICTTPPNGTHATSSITITSKTTAPTPTLSATGVGAPYACNSWILSVNGCDSYNYDIKWEKKATDGSWSEIIGKTDYQMIFNGIEDPNPSSKAGFYRVSCYNGSSCSGNASTEFEVKTLSTPAAPTIVADKTLICNTDIANLRASGCTGLVTWNTGATGNLLQVDKIGNYTATCSISCAPTSTSSNLVIITSCRPTIKAGENLLCSTTSTTNLTSKGCSGVPIFEKYNGSTWDMITNSMSVGVGIYRAKCSVNASNNEISETTTIKTGSLPDAPTLSTTQTSICGTGGSATTMITAQGCSETTKWSTKEIGPFINITGNSGTYTAQCIQTCPDVPLPKESVNSNSISITYSQICDCNSIVIKSNVPDNTIFRFQNLVLEVPYMTGVNYLWNGPNIPSGTVLNTNKLTIPGIQINQAGGYSVTMTTTIAPITTCQKSISIQVLDINPCGTTFETFAYGNSPSGQVGVGEELRLTSGGGDKYEWSGPNGFYSQDQFPKIPLATLANSGRYNVKISKWMTDRYCDDFKNFEVVIGECNFAVGASFSQTTDKFNLSLWSNKSLNGAEIIWKNQAGIVINNYPGCTGCGNPTIDKNNDTRGTYYLTVKLRGCEINDQINVQFVAPASYSGHLDIATCSEIRGWIMDSNNQGLSLDYKLTIRIAEANGTNSTDYSLTVNENGSGSYVYFNYKPLEKYRNGKKYIVTVLDPNNNPIQNTSSRSFRCCAIEFKGDFINPAIECIDGKRNVTVNIKDAKEDASYTSEYSLEKVVRDEDGNSSYISLINNQASNVFNALESGNYRITYRQRPPDDAEGCKITTGVSVVCEDPTVECEPPVITVFPGETIREGMGIQPKFYASVSGLPATTPATAAKVLRLDGSGAVTIPDLSNQVTNITAEILVKPDLEVGISVGDASDASRQRYLYMGYNASTTDAIFLLSVGSNGVNVIEFANNFRRVACSYEGRITDWTHIAVVYTNNIASLYINGVLVKTAPSAPVGVQGPLRILGPNHIGTDNDRGFKGYVKYARFWFTSRTAQQISNNATNTDLPGNTTGLKGTWVYDAFPVNGVIAKPDYNIKLEGEAAIVTLNEAASPPVMPQLTWWLDGEQVGSGDTYTMPQSLVKEGSYTYTVKYTKPDNIVCEATKVITVNNAEQSDLSGCYVIKTTATFGDFESGPGSVYAAYQQGANNTVRIHAKGDFDEDIWKLEHQGSGYYKIINNYAIDKILAHDNNSIALLKDRRVVDDTQIWKIVEEGTNTGKFKIIPKLNADYALGYAVNGDYINADMAAGTYVTNSASQLYNLERTACPTPPKPCEVDNNIAYERWLNVGLNSHTETTWNALDVAAYIKTNPVATYATRIAPSSVQVSNGTTPLFTSPAIPTTDWREYKIIGRISGYICPPISGLYSFYLKTNEWAALYMSPEENQNAKKLISTQVGYTEDWNFATAVKLTQGRMYYFEIITKDIGPQEAINHDASLGWRTPGSNTTVEMPLTNVSSIPRDMKPLKKRSIGECVPPPPEFTGTENLTNLFPKDKIYANNWEITIEKVSGDNGLFTGLGTTYVKNKYLQDTKIVVEFSGITVNDEYELVNGVVKAIYDETKSNIVDVTDELKKVKSMIEALDELAKITYDKIGDAKKLKHFLAEFREQAEKELPEALQIQANAAAQAVEDAATANPFNPATYTAKMGLLQEFRDKKDKFLNSYVCIIKKAVTQLTQSGTDYNETEKYNAFKAAANALQIDLDEMEPAVDETYGTSITKIEGSNSTTIDDPRIPALFAAERKYNASLIAKAFKDGINDNPSEFAKKIIANSKNLTEHVYSILPGNCYVTNTSSCTFSTNGCETDTVNSVKGVFIDAITKILDQQIYKQ